MQKWEYITAGWMTAEAMNQMGADGWELVSVTVHEKRDLMDIGTRPHVYTLFFKRPVQS